MRTLVVLCCLTSAASADQTDFSSCTKATPLDLLNTAPATSPIPPLPFSVVTATVGATAYVFVSHGASTSPAISPGVTVFTQSGFNLAKEIPVTTDGRPWGIAVAPDVHHAGKSVLLVGTELHVLVYPLDFGTSIPPTPQVVTLPVPPNTTCSSPYSGTRQVVASSDGTFAVTTAEGTSCDNGGLAFIDLDTMHYHQRKIDHNPAGLALTASKHVYVASEKATSVSQNHNHGTGALASGSLMTFSVDPASTSDKFTLLSSVNAGCTAVRVAVDAAESTVWVAARGSNRLMAFSADALLSKNGETPGASLVREVSAGTKPTGLALYAGDGKIAVADTNRDDTAGTGHAEVMIYSTSGILTGSATAPTKTFRFSDSNIFPREIAAGTANLYVTLFEGAAVAIIPLP